MVLVHLVPMQNLGDFVRLTLLQFIRLNDKVDIYKHITVKLCVLNWFSKTHLDVKILGLIKFILHNMSL